jgi:hypothetical protein
LQLGRIKDLKKGPVQEVSLGDSYVLDISNNLKLKRSEEPILYENKFSFNLNSQNNYNDIINKI